MEPDNPSGDADPKREEGPREEIELPDNSTIIKQVQYAWLWSSMPWLVVLGAIFFTEFLIAAEPLVGSIATVIILLPRYLMWRNTAYILTDDAIIYQRGGLTGFQRYRIPIEKLRDARPKFGYFGKTLGYQKVDILFDTGTVASLVYVPATFDFAGHLLGLIGTVSLEGEDAEAPPDEQQQPDANGRAEPE